MMLYHTNVLLHGQLGTECRVQKFTKTYEALSKLARISEFFMNPEYPKTALFDLHLYFLVSNILKDMMLSSLMSPLSMLSHFYILLSFVLCLKSHISCFLSNISGLMSYVSCLISPVFCLINPAICLMSHISYPMSPVTCLLSHV